MERWDKQLIKHLDAIIDIANWYKNPFVNDGIGSSICHEIYIMAQEMKEQIKNPKIEFFDKHCINTVHKNINLV